MKRITTIIFSSIVVTTCNFMAVAHAVDPFEIGQPLLPDDVFYEHETYIPYPFLEPATFDTDNFKSCAIESFKVSHGLLGKHYEEDVLDFYLNYADRAVGDPTITSVASTAFSDITELDCHHSGTLSIETSEGPASSTDEVSANQSDYSACTDLAGVTNGFVSRSVRSDGTPGHLSYDDDFGVNHSAAGQMESLSGYTRTSFFDYVDDSGLILHEPRLQGSRRSYLDFQYQYAVGGLPPVLLPEVSGYYTREKSTSTDGDHSDDGEFVIVDTYQYIDGCYHTSGDVHTYVDDFVFVEYLLPMKMIADTYQVLQAEISMRASDGSSLMLYETPGDPLHARVQITSASGAVTTTPAVPWDDLLP